MRTLGTQVRLRRLISSVGDAVERMLSEPAEREMGSMIAARLLQLASDVSDAWRSEARAGRPGPAFDNHVEAALHQIELAITGLSQHGADLELLESDFNNVALPLEVFLRGLDIQPALRRTA